MQFVPQQMSNCFGVKLDISDLEFEGKEQLEPFLTFNVRTYKVLSATGSEPEKFKTVMGAANWYLANVATDEQKILMAKVYALSCQMIRNDMSKLIEYPTKLSEFVIQLGEMYLTVVEQCGLMDAFYKYADANVSLQDISGYGSRPQDSKELTFSVDEMRALMNLAYVIKAAAPIFGELIMNIPDQYDAEGNKKTSAPKDIKVVNFLQPLILKHYSALDSKFRFTIEHIVDANCKNNNSSAAIFAGLIPSTRVAWIRASILVRNFVCCVLERTESNICRFVDTMVHNHLISQNNLANKNQVRPRKPIAALGAGEEADNTAQMETDSVVSNKPIDVEIIVSVAVDSVVDDMLVTYQFTHDELDTNFRYLMNHPVVQTQLNRFVLTSIFGDKLGGGRGIEMLGRKPFTKLACLLQMIAFNLGLREFGHMLTATKTGMCNVIKTDEEIKFELNYSTGFPYRTCKDRFASSSRASDGKEWDKQMKDICDDIIHNCYVYNTPPAIMDALGEEAPSNGETIPVEVEIINEACTIINMFAGSGVN